MASQEQSAASVFRTNLRRVTITLVVALATGILLAPAAQAQTYEVIYNFTGGADGGMPYGQFTLDRAGNLYGTNSQGGGVHKAGTVFKLTYKDSGWILTPLYSFQAGNDGANPYGRLVFGLDGALYGTTYNGGTGCGGTGCGTVFRLSPSPSACKTALCPWRETVLYRFSGNDGAHPDDIAFDAAGNLYGTTIGFPGGGNVYELTPSNGGWTQSVLHTFTGTGGDLANPTGGVVFDAAGNLYGKAVFGGKNDNGGVFQLVPSESGWTENILYEFDNFDGAAPGDGLIMDAAGNLFGGTHDTGSVFELSPSGSGWIYTLLSTEFVDGGPTGALTLDTAHNLYGTAGGDTLYGNVFELTPSSPQWIFTALHVFTGGDDGYRPEGGVVRGANDILYGTTLGGGTNRWGLAFEITP